MPAFVEDYLDRRPARRRHMWIDVMRIVGRHDGPVILSSEHLSMFTHPGITHFLDAVAAFGGSRLVMVERPASKLLPSMYHGLAKREPVP
jgi:hypothetical protein